MTRVVVHIFIFVLIDVVRAIVVFVEQLVLER